MSIINLNSFNSKDELKIKDKNYKYYNINKAAKELNISIDKLPYSIKILLENALRNEDGRIVKTEDIKAIANWGKLETKNEIAFYPSRVLMQDFTGVPAIVDLAAMRDAMNKLGGDAKKINPLAPVDLVIDHSVQVDYSAAKDSLSKNVKLEMERNYERYAFLRWGQEAFDNFRVVPPGTGICHQVNLEYLAQVVWTKSLEGEIIAYPDSLVGTDSHTTMVNGLAVLGWGVGGIEAEAAMLGQGLSMLLPDVIGFKLTGKCKEGVTATDLVLTVTEMLRKKGVVNKFVEFYGEGLNNLRLADRATIANMAPEYGATCGFFPIDNETINYLKLTNRDEDRIELVEAYAKAQGMWRDETSNDPVFTDFLELDLSSIEPSLAGPKRPQDRVILSKVKESFASNLPSLTKNTSDTETKYEVGEKGYKIGSGDVIIAAITSCTNTSNPSVMIAAGLVAKLASELGIISKPWVKTSLAPGSKVVSKYLRISGLQSYLDNLGFNVVGYGCTTCIGNSGPVDKSIEETVNKNGIVAVSVLSGNRNFEGRIHPAVKANYLASPPLVVAYALAGTVNLNLATDPICFTKEGKPVYLKDIWPSNELIQEYMNKFITKNIFKAEYQDVFKGEEEWQKIKIDKSELYNWDKTSTYINNPPYFENIKQKTSALTDIKGAKLLAIFGDSITTDHISPAGNIAKNSPAATYLENNGVKPQDFNSYGARRGNHEVMMRGTFANIRIKNELLSETEGGYANHNGKIMSIYDAAMKYKEEQLPLVIVAGKEYGTGSSRDWAAKGTFLLGIKAVIAESFERIHRSNLVGMGVIPLTFQNGLTRHDLKLKGDEKFDIVGLDSVMPQKNVTCIIHRADGSQISVDLLCRIDTADEMEFVKAGGILQSVIYKLS
ncbi:MAG: aconitate hydratase AcnA [Alphaproteobacteria bacterium]